MTVPPCPSRTRVSPNAASRFCLCWTLHLPRPTQRPALPTVQLPLASTVPVLLASRALIGWVRSRRLASEPTSVCLAAGGVYEPPKRTAQPYPCPALMVGSEPLSGLLSCGVVSALSAMKFEFSLAGHAERKMVLAAPRPAVVAGIFATTS